MIKNYQYICIPVNLIPQKVINEYNLINIMHDGYMYIDFRKSIYGMGKAGALSNKQL